MSESMEFFLVYDYLGPNGYIPFYYKKEEIPKILDKNQHTRIKYNKFSSDTKQILSQKLWLNQSIIKSNFYLVLVDTTLKNEPLENILSDSLNLLIKNYSNNIKVIYFDHEVTMHTLL